MALCLATCFLLSTQALSTDNAIVQGFKQTYFVIYCMLIPHNIYKILCHTRFPQPLALMIFLPLFPWCSLSLRHIGLVLFSYTILSENVMVSSFLHFYQSWLLVMMISICCYKRFFYDEYAHAFVYTRKII